MKLSQSSNSVALGGMSDAVTGFKIEANAKAFRALSSTLYQDQIGSVLREIVCNGMDANKMTGSTIPVEVKLPNSVNPTFYVRDTGPGLAEEDVKSLYTTYFASTKDQSNDQIGAFGLGSKSPFAYTDSFTVVSAHGGMKKTYAAFLSEAGDPSILKVTEEPVSSDWEHGLEIGFPVKPQDFGEFERKALIQLEWLDPLPTLKGVVTKLERPSLEWSFGAFSQRQGQGNASTTVVMGGVAYPLSRSDVESLANKVNMRSCLHVRSMYITVPLGSVEVALSREGLAMTEHTLQSLSKIINDNTEALRAKLKVENQQIEGRPLAETRDILTKSNLLSAVSALLGWNYGQACRPSPGVDVSMSIANMVHYLSQKGISVDAVLGYKETRNGFILEHNYPTNSTAFGKSWEEMVWLVNDKAYSEAGIRDRVRQFMAGNSTMRIALIVQSGSEEQFDQVVGVPLLRLSDISLAKGPVSKGNTQPEFGQTALLADRKKLDKPVNHGQTVWDRVDVTPPGPLPALKAGEVGYFIRTDLARVTAYDSVAATVGHRLSGLNSALRRIKAPEGDYVYAVHRKRDVKKALNQGYLDLVAVLKAAADEIAEELATLPVRQTVTTRDLRTSSPYNSTYVHNCPALLLRALGQTPGAKEVLAGTWISRDIEKLSQPHFVSSQDDYICLFNLINRLTPETGFSVTAKVEQPSDSRWPEQEAVFQKLNLPELLVLANLNTSGTVQLSNQVVLAFLELLKRRPEPKLPLQAVA